MSLSEYEIARKRVKDKKKFHRNLATYIIFSLFFFFLNIFSGSNHLWFIYPVLGWGIGIVMEYYKVYVDPKLEDQAVEKELQRLRERNIPIDEEERLELRDLPEKEARPSGKSWKDSDLV
ncbi:MAG: 2TM domain-containing protein [Bacteroidota bacterium]